MQGEQEEARPLENGFLPLGTLQLVFIIERREQYAVPPCNCAYKVLVMCVILYRIVGTGTLAASSKFQFEGRRAKNEI